MIGSFFSWITGATASSLSITDERELVNFTGATPLEVMKRYVQFNGERSLNKAAIQQAFYTYFVQVPNVIEQLEVFLLSVPGNDCNFYRAFIDLFRRHNNEAFATALSVSYIFFLHTIGSDDAQEEMVEEFFRLESSCQAIAPLFVKKSENLQRATTSNFLHQLVVFVGNSERIDRLRTVCSLLQELEPFVTLETCTYLVTFFAMNWKQNAAVLTLWNEAKMERYALSVISADYRQEHSMGDDSAVFLLLQYLATCSQSNEPRYRAMRGMCLSLIDSRDIWFLLPIDFDTSAISAFVEDKVRRVRAPRYHEEASKSVVEAMKAFLITHRLPEGADFAFLAEMYRHAESIGALYFVSLVQAYCKSRAAYTQEDIRPLLWLFAASSGEFREWIKSILVGFICENDNVSLLYQMRAYDHQIFHSLTLKSFSTSMAKLRAHFPLTVALDIRGATFSETTEDEIADTFPALQSLTCSSEEAPLFWACSNLPLRNLTLYGVDPYLLAYVQSPHRFFSTLERLEIRRNFKMSSNALSKLLERLPMLSALKMDLFLKDEHLAVLQEYAPNLTSFEGCFNYGELSLRALASFFKATSNMTHLALNGCFRESEQVPFAHALQHLGTLRSLTLQSLATNAIVKTVAHVLPNLLALNLKSSFQVTDEAILKLSELTQLRELHLQGTQATRNGLIKLAKSLPDLQILSVTLEDSDAAILAQAVAPVRVVNNWKKIDDRMLPMLPLFAC